MYKAAVRALMRYCIGRLNEGDYSLMLRLASPDFELAFPGQNSWSTMFRPQARGRDGHVTHRGIDEASAFADRVVAEGLQFQIEDILVNGPPWNTRIALRVNDHIPGPGAASPTSPDDGAPDVYANRAILFLTVRWGRLVHWEDYEDTERVADWDRRIAAASAPAGSP